MLLVGWRRLQLRLSLQARVKLAILVHLQLQVEYSRVGHCTPEKMRGE